MNSFRSKMLGGKSAKVQLLAEKPGDRVAGESVPLRETVVRNEVRSANHRDDDRHRLSDESAIALWKGALHPVHLINLSGGGAMVSASFAPKLWDRVDLTLGDCGTLESAVRWIKGDRLGLEFAHETQLETDPVTRAQTLQAVISRSFPDVVFAAPSEAALPFAAAPEAPAPEPFDASRRDSARHPLIWSGQVHFNHDTCIVRLRNISASGALVESATAFPVGAEVLLDLGDAGQLFAKVHWSRGEQAGLRFQSPFDVTSLSKSKPELAASRWTQPEYLREGNGDSSPWAKQWGRLDLPELSTHLEGFLKR